jgi:hypothetical protein
MNNEFKKKHFKHVTKEINHSVNVNDRPFRGDSGGLASKLAHTTPSQ